MNEAKVGFTQKKLQENEKSNKKVNLKKDLFLKLFRYLYNIYSEEEYSTSIMGCANRG